MRDIYKYSIFKGSCKRKELTYAQKVYSVVNQIKTHRINCSMSEEEKKKGRADQGIFSGMWVPILLKYVRPIFQEGLTPFYGFKYIVKKLK